MGATPLNEGTWIVVADGEKALFLENIGDSDYLHFKVVGKEVQENPPDGIQSANRPGRFQDGPGVQRSAVEDTDWHQLQKERFADDLADMLYKSAHRGEFGSIVICAAPTILGEMRAKLHKEVQDRLVGEIDKTLTGHPVDEIETIVKDSLS